MTDTRQGSATPLAADPHAIDYALRLPGRKGPTGIDYGGLTFSQDNCPNGVEPTVHCEPDGDYLRLCVQRDAYLGAAQGEPQARDRCELRDTKLPLGTPVQYDFDLRVEESFPFVDARMVLAQIKAPYFDADGGSPLFALRFERGRFIATVEHLYEAKDAPIKNGTEVSRYLSPIGAAIPQGDALAFDHHLFGNAPGDNQELQVRAIMATDGSPLPSFVTQDYRWTTSGIELQALASLPADPYRWHRFRLRIAPTREKDFAGLVELFVGPEAGEPVLVARARGEFGHRGYLDPEHNTGPRPDQAYQYFKIGPYRDKTRFWGGGPAAIHVRNVRRSSWPDGQAFYETQAMV